MITDQIQEALRESGIDGWLFFDHHQRDPLAYQILNLSSERMATRRWYYLIPAEGEPRKLVHRIESGALDSLPGHKDCYSRWSDQQTKLGELLAGCELIAMQYSPNCAIPYVSLVDAGTLELIRTQGVEIVSSADLVQQFQARWSEYQVESHFEAGKLVDQTRRAAFDFIGQRLRAGNSVSEYEVQQFIMTRFEENGLTANHGPIVAANANASDPHYEPAPDRSAYFKRGDLVLIDMFAKLKAPASVYYDITWMGFCGPVVPDEMARVFDVVKGARKRASELVISKISAGEEIAGYQVDDAARGYVEDRGFGEFFFHRTGHSIGTEVHGTGANMDNFESHDERRIIANTCFSIEPGVYLRTFGVRSEVNMYVADGWAKVTGEQQEELVQIAC